MEKEFIDIISDIISKRKFLRLKNEKHHTTNRYSHSYSVAYETYKICKRLNFDYKSATKAAILHDFFFDEEFRGMTKKNKLVMHYKKAIENSLKITKLSEKEKNMIASHMFPVGGKLPRTKEAIILDYADDIVSIRERKENLKQNAKYKIRKLRNIY